MKKRGLRFRFCVFEGLPSIFEGASFSCAFSGLTVINFTNTGCNIASHADVLGGSSRTSVREEETRDEPLKNLITTQITHTRGGRQALALLNINT